MTYSSTAFHRCTPAAFMDVLMGSARSIGRVDVAEGEERRNLVFEYNIAEDTIYGVAEGATSVRAIQHCVNRPQIGAIASVVDVCCPPLHSHFRRLCSATQKADVATTGSVLRVRRGR